MASKNLLTYGSKVYSVKQDYYSSVVVLPTNTTVPLNSTYFFLSKVDPWPNEEDPPNPEQSQRYIKQTFKNMFVAKKITSNDVSPVIERNDWVSGTIYDHYDDTIDMFELDTNGYLVKKFYVKNKYDQVFKCLWNADGDPSTDEPYFEPGTYGNNNIFQGADGYKWRFMYVIDSGLKVKFLDNTWMPVPIGANTPSPLVATSGSGSIDTINVLNGGTGYDPANSSITVQIVGDGTGANATIGTAEVSNGAITDVIVTSSGKDYSFANVIVTSAAGSNVQVVAYPSPIGGHGFDAKSELGCSHTMFSIEFDGSENNVVPTDIDFHQVGIVINPTTVQYSPNPANATIYKTTTDLVVAPGLGVFVEDEIVYQGTSLATATFTGTVLSFDTSTNVLRLINTVGTSLTNASVFGNTSTTVRTVFGSSTPNFVLQSGYIFYIENRTGIQRSPDGIEQFKIVLGY